MNTQTKLSQIRALMRDGKFPFVDMVSQKKTGEIVFRKGYFYRNGMTASGFMDTVNFQLKNAGINFTVVDYGDHWAPFNGGATLARSSHFYVVIK